MTSTRTRAVVWAFAVAGLVLAPTASAQIPVGSSPAASATAAATPVPQAPAAEGVVSTQEVVFALDALSVRGARPARFFQGKAVPDGFTLPDLKWSVASGDVSRFLQIAAADLLQRDERVVARAGVGSAIRVRVDWTRLPYRVGDGARPVWAGVGTDRLTLSPDLRGLLEDPDGDRVLGTAADNTLVPGLARRMLASTDPVSPSIDRSVGDVAVMFSPRPNWNVDLAFRRENREGLRAGGTGTYHRLTFASSSGLGSDERFSNRGAEILVPIDYTTTSFEVGTDVRGRRAFGDVSLQMTDFSNQYVGLTYDHPLWLTPLYGGSAPAGLDRGWARGLWQEGRIALPPDSESWHVTASGGFTLPRSTRVTATLVRGRLTQDVPFLPLIANPTGTGRVDLNGDGIVNAADDGTTVNTLPQRSLDGRVNTTAFTLSFSTRPARPLTINVRLPYYDYDSQHGEILFPFRGYYTDSYWSNAFQGKPNLARPFDFSRRALFAEAVVRPTDQVLLRAFGENQHRSYATRQVSATDTTAFGVGLGLTPQPWADLRVTYRTSSRTFDGTYTPTFAGEQQALRMFDIANLDRRALALDVNLDPSERVSVGVNVRYTKDEYPDSTFGLQGTKSRGGGIDLSFRPIEGATLYAYVDLENYDYKGHGDTKMTVFNVAGNDWFYAIADETRTVGGGAQFEIVPDTWVLAFDTTYVNGTVLQENRNPSTRITSVLAATAHTFPEQQSTLLSGQLRLTRRLSARVSLGLAYLLEDFRLADFAWDGLQPYAHDSLSVDDNLRYTFLDLRYGSYTAHLGRVFLKISF